MTNMLNAALEIFEPESFSGYSVVLPSIDLQIHKLYELLNANGLGHAIRMRREQIKALCTMNDSPAALGGGSPAPSGGDAPAPIGGSDSLVPEPLPSPPAIVGDSADLWFIGDSSLYQYGSNKRGSSLWT